MASARREAAVTERIVVEIPVPPSANNLFLNTPGHGRVRTKAYRQWTRLAGWRVKEQRPGRIVGPYRLHLRLPNATRGDVDNRLKATLDLLVSLGVVDDDRLAQDVRVSRGEAEGCRIEIVKITEVAQAPP